MWVIKVSDFLNLTGTPPMHQELQERGLLATRVGGAELLSARFH